MPYKPYAPWATGKHEDTEAPSAVPTPKEVKKTEKPSEVPLTKDTEGAETASKTSALRLPYATDTGGSGGTTLARDGAAFRADPVAGRVRAFQRQLDEWVRSGRAAVPLLTLPGASTGEGLCISCGEPIDASRTWRCLVCVQAVRMVLGM